MECQAANEEIVIVAPRLPEAAGEAAYSAFEIDPVVLETATRLDEALRAAPGVSTFRRNDSAAANPTIQGLSIRASAPSGAGRALVTLDGQPLNDPFGGWVIWGAVPPETIANATVLRGAGAGPYGAGALTGTVQLDERRREGAMLSLEGGERGQWRAAGVGEAHGDAWSFMLAAAAQQDDGWIPVRAGRGAADAQVWSDSMTGVARVEWRNGERVFSARVGGYSESRGAGLVGAESISDGASLSMTLAAPAGDVAWRVQAWAMASDLYNTSVATAPDRSTTTPANEQYETPAFGWGGNAALRWTGDGYGVEIGADLRTADGETRERFSFMGGQFTRKRIAGGRTLTAGAYVEGWREIGPRLFTGGARADVYRAWDGNRVERLIATGAPVLEFAPEDTETFAPTARLGVHRAFGDLFVRSAAYAGFRPPTLNELHRPFRVGNDVTEANAALEPEHILGFDLGAAAVTVLPIGQKHARDAGGKAIGARVAKAGRDDHDALRFTTLDIGHENGFDLGHDTVRVLEPGAFRRLRKHDQVAAIFWRRQFRRKLGKKETTEDHHAAEYREHQRFGIHRRLQRRPIGGPHGIKQPIDEPRQPRTRFHRFDELRAHHGRQGERRER